MFLILEVLDDEGEKFGLLGQAVGLCLLIAVVTAIWLKWGAAYGVISLLVYIVLSRALFSNERINED